MNQNQGKNPSDKAYFSTAELARLLGISRIAVFKKIKNGTIHAEKIGRNYVIPRSEFEVIVGAVVPERKKREIEDAVERVTDEYGEALRKLGGE